MKKAWYRFIDFCTKKGIDRVVGSRVLVYFISFFFALIFATYRDRFLSSTKLFFSSIFKFSTLDSIFFDWLTLFFYLILMFWLYILATHYGRINKIGSEKMRIAIEEIKTTFFRTPNIRIFLLYGNLTKYIIQSFHLARNLYGQNPIPEAIYSNTIKDALGEVCKVIHQFMDQPKEEFSANIMVFIDNRKVEGSRIINELKKNKELFIIGNHLDSSCFNGVLLSLNELNYNMDNIQPNLFAIPLLNNKLIKEKQIPGAASAFFDGEFIMDDTLKIEDNHVEISNDIKSQAEVFYKKNKDRFRSFGSFSISLIDSDHSNKNKHIMIGVLTLYYKNINILGEGTSFHSTFNALLQPILHSLASELDNYLNMYRDDLIKKNYFNHETNAPK